MNRIALTGLARFDLPTRTAYLSDGGFMAWNGATYVASDTVLGTISSIDALEEGAGNMIPAIQLTMLPPSSAAPSDLAQPGWQKCRARFWIAQYDPDAGAVIGTPDLMFDGFLDQINLTVGATRRDLAVTIVSWLEQLFEQNIGNSLNGTWQKSIWPGETGHDNATGLTLSVAWGVVSPPAATVYSPPSLSYVGPGSYLGLS